MEAISPPPPEAPEEDLPKMSFGDHLEELRKRLFLSLIAVGVCVFGMLPFKAQVTSVYVAPYRDMWIRGYLDYVDQLEKDTAERGVDGLDPAAS